jgi:hypothetical protein
VKQLSNNESNTIAIWLKRLTEYPDRTYQCLVRRAISIVCDVLVCASVCARVRVCACARVHVCACARVHVCTCAHVRVP